MAALVFAETAEELEKCLPKLKDRAIIINRGTDEIRNEKARVVNIGEFEKSPVFKNVYNQDWFEEWAEKRSMQGKSFKEFLVFDDFFFQLLPKFCL